MRLLMLTLDPPSKAGGIEGRARAYARQLSGSGHDVRVVSVEHASSETEEFFEGARLIRLPKTKSIQEIIRIAIRNSSDPIFLLSGGSSILGILISIFCRVSGRREVIFFYGRDILRRRREVYGRLIVMLSILLSKGVGVNSVYTSRLIRHESVRRPYVMYPGVDSRWASFKARSKTHQQGLGILFVGRLVPRKGVDLLIEAFGRTSEHFPNLTLDIVGNGPEIANLKALAEEAGLKDRVIFHGELTGPPLWELYSNCDIFVMPSRETADDVEGFGTVFLEAGLFGKPSIGTRSGGIPEAIIDGRTGVLIGSPQVPELSEALICLIQNGDLRQELGRNAQSYVRANFTWEQATQRLVQLLLP